MALSCLFLHETLLVLPLLNACLSSAKLSSTSLILSPGRRKNKGEKWDDKAQLLIFVSILKAISMIHSVAEEWGLRVPVIESYLFTYRCWFNKCLSTTSTAQCGQTIELWPQDSQLRFREDRRLYLRLLA